MNAEKSQQVIERELVRDPQGLNQLQRKIVDNIPSVFLEFCRGIHLKIEQMRGRK